MNKPYQPTPVRPELGQATPAAPAKTIESAKSARDTLAARISWLLADFEKRTGCHVDGIQLERLRGADHQGRPRQGHRVKIAARLGESDVIQDLFAKGAGA